jgi:hypothetical protein
MEKPAMIRHRMVMFLGILGAGLSADSGAAQQNHVPAYADKSKLLIWRDAEGAEYAIKTRALWAKRRAHILAHMQQVMGPLPDDSRKVPLDLTITEEVNTARYIRKKLTFAVEQDDRVPAYLFLPLGAKGKRPAVLCLHPTQRKLGNAVVAGLQGDDNNLAYAVHLANRGYVTLAPAYVNMGEYKYDVYGKGYASATMKGIWNHMRAVDLLQSLPDVDPQRIGALGHSLGGHNSMFVAVFDERIKCIVSNCGFCSFSTYFKGNLTGWSHDGYMPRIRTHYDLQWSKMPFDFPGVVAALAPRAFLASAPVRDHNFDVGGVKECIAAAMPVYELLGAKDKLGTNYPDCDHSFPDGVQQAAYDWMDRWLKPN